MDAITADLKRFLHPDTKKWYRRHGIPFLRQYLFHGPPGTGKTSTIRALSSMLGKSCCFLGIANNEFSNQILGDALSGLPDRPLLVLEDVDALFSKRESNDKEGGGSNQLTFAGFLNSLDGVLSVDGVITIMTTNHVERLDAALLRSGRVDRKFHFGHPNESQVSRLFKAFYENAEEDIVVKFVDKIQKRPDEDKAMNMSTLQELFITCREMTSEECVEFADTFFEEKKILSDGEGRDRVCTMSKSEKKNSDSED